MYYAYPGTPWTKKDKEMSRTVGCPGGGLPPLAVFWSTQPSALSVGRLKKSYKVGKTMLLFYLFVYSIFQKFLT